MYTSYIFKEAYSIYPLPCPSFMIPFLYISHVHCFEPILHFSYFALNGHLLFKENLRWGKIFHIYAHICYFLWCSFFCIGPNSMFFWSEKTSAIFLTHFLMINAISFLLFSLKMSLFHLYFGDIILGCVEFYIGTFPLCSLKVLLYCFLDSIISDKNSIFICVPLLNNVSELNWDSDTSMIIIFINC